MDDYSFKEKFYNVLDKQVKKYQDVKNAKLLRSFKKLAQSFDQNENEKQVTASIDVYNTFDKHLQKLKSSERNQNDKQAIAKEGLHDLVN